MRDLGRDQKFGGKKILKVEIFFFEKKIKELQFKKSILENRMDNEKILIFLKKEAGILIIFIH